MSVVKKMYISGVRSFHPHDTKQQMISFQTPLTLIVGINGSGKTTTIEALKYAITNSFPPNSNKGGSFVNDPKLTNGMESMGMVKLELLDAKGHKVEISRRVKVTVKDKLGNLTKKEMEAVLKITDSNGKIKEVNSKCLDVKGEMCRIMGVSEAILNNVIFCHQEDSCWPLDEGKKVKEKFDSIFNTTMYIKCVDLLTKHDKEMASQAKTENEKLNYARDNRKVARKKKQLLEEKEIELQAILDEVEEKKVKLRDLEEKIKGLMELESGYTKMKESVAGIRARVEEVQRHMKDVEHNIKKKLNKDVPSLEAEIEESNIQFNSKQEERKQLENKLRSKEDELRKLNTQHQGFLIQEGKFQQEEVANAARIENLKVLMSDIAKVVKKLQESSQDVSFSNSMGACLDACGSDVEDMSIDSVLRALSSAIRHRETEINRTKTQYEKEEKEHQKKIDELRAKKASVEKEIEMKNSQIKDNASSCNELRTRLREIEGSSTKLEQLEEEEANYDKELSVIKESGIIVKYEDKIKQISEELRKFEDQIVDAESDVQLLTNDESIRGQISLINKQRTQKEQDCTKTLGKIKDNLNGLLSDIQEEGLSETFENKKDSVNREVNGQKNEQKSLEKQLTVTETELKRNRTELSKKESKFEGYKEKFEDILIDGGDFDETYTKVKEELEEKQKNNFYAEAAVYLFKKQLKDLKKKKCCPLCKRGVEENRQIEEITGVINKEISGIEDRTPVDSAEVDQLKQKEKKLLKLKPNWDEYKKLEEEVPSLKDKVAKLEEETNGFKERLDDMNCILAELEDNKSRLDKSSKDIALLETARKEFMQFEKKIESMESTRNPKAIELLATLTLCGAKTKLQELKNSVKTKQMEKDNSGNMLNKKRDEINSFTNRKNEVRGKILKITSELQNREALEAQKKELEDGNKQLQEMVSSLKQQVPSVKTEISEAEKTKSACTEKKEQHIQSLRQEKDSLEKQKNKLSEIGQQIEEFERKKTQFSETQRKANECKRKVQESEKSKTNIEKELDGVKNDIVNHESKQRNLQDNLSFTKKMEEMEKLKAELEEKKKLFDSTRNDGVAAEREKRTSDHKKTSTRKHELEILMRERQNTINELKKELGERPLVNAEEDFVERLVKKTVYEKTQRDLRRYKTALDQAIMAFHNKKMERINRSLMEYWRRIYQGNDIDYIKIQTEAASGPPGTGNKVKIDAKGRKSYNYRVVMVRHDKELDMRGRCSAGQRVLACIIIRMALADTFSARCGIITLDEPTTNLDQKNINSLAEALKGLANRMSQQRNFQLIVITHDQEFTERLSEIDAVEKYWKVSRDNMGFSQITMVPKHG